MRTSGLVLDVFDDFNGEVVRSIWPTQDAIPATVKEASALSPPDRDKLPDDVFALVLLNGEDKLRKYACIDEGNTVLSVEYFLKNAHKLPAEAQKTTAENLKVACSWYDLLVPEPIEKIALGLGTAMTALTAGPIIKGTSQQIRGNMAATRAGEAMGARVVTPADRAALLKQGEVSGTNLAPNQGPPNPTVDKAKAVVQKTATVGHLVAGSTGKDTPPADNLGVEHKKQPPSAPQAGHLHPTVDVSNMKPPTVLTEKKATLFAVPSCGKYPLDSYEQVKTASSYFDQHYKHMSPEVRHEFATHLVKRASDLAIDVSLDARKYGSELFAPEAEIKAAFDARRSELDGNKDALALLEPIERIARTRLWKEANGSVRHFDPVTVVALVEEFDKVAGLDHHYDRTIPDPYYSIYGIEKNADTAAWSDVIQNEMVTSEDLERLAKIGAFSVKTTFGADFQEKFLKNPVGQYKSLPRSQKLMLIRMANSTQPGVERTYF